MRLVRFEKWFIDVLTKEQDYIIVFHTITEFLGFRICFLEVNTGVFHINKKLNILNREDHTLKTREGNILIEPGMGNLRLSLNDIDLELALTPVHNSGFNLPGMNIPETGQRSLRWKPLYLKAMVSGKLRIEGETRMIIGNGYVDYLLSTLSPFKVPVRQLYWGRLHSKDVDLAYSYALGEDNQVIGCQMIIQSHAKRTRINKLTVQTGEWKQYNPPGILAPESYSLEASGDTLQVVLSVEHLKPAVISEFAETPEDMGRFRRALLKRISRDPRGIKFNAISRLEISQGGKTQILDEIHMIDEFVVFS